MSPGSQRSADGNIIQGKAMTCGWIYLPVKIKWQRVTAHPLLAIVQRCNRSAVSSFLLFYVVRSIDRLTKPPDEKAGRM